MNRAPAPGTHSRRRVSYGAVVGAVLLSGLAAYVTLTGPALLGARPVSAAPASSSPVPQSVEPALELVKRTELNAVVIDVKGDRGLIPYRTEVPAALEAGALGPVIIKDFDAQIAAMKAQGIYTIARVVVFKDNVLAHHRRDLA